MGVHICKIYDISKSQESVYTEGAVGCAVIKVQEYGN